MRFGLLLCSGFPVSDGRCKAYRFERICDTAVSGRVYPVHASGSKPGLLNIDRGKTRSMLDGLFSSLRVLGLKRWIADFSFANCFD